MRKEEKEGKNERIRGGDLLLIVLVSFLMIAVGITLCLLPASAYSERENRSLQTWTVPTAESLLSGRYAEELRLACVDQFPLREQIVTWKAMTERALGFGENHGVLFGENGYLIPRYKKSDESILENNLAAMDGFSATIAEQGIPTFGLFAPRSADVMSACLPDLYEGVADLEAQSRLLAAIEDRPFAAVLPKALLGQAAAEGRQTQYRTDHHWTTHGAYLSYCALMEQMGIEPCDESYFRIETVSEDFLGSFYAKAGGVADRTDTVALYRYGGDGAFLIRNKETGERFDGFYDEAALEGADHYRIFLGGNYGRLTVCEPSAERPRLLLIKDSYANCLIPFLALHFDLDVIDLRYYPKSISALLAENDYALALFVQGVSTLTDDSALARLR